MTDRKITQIDFHEIGRMEGSEYNDGNIAVIASTCDLHLQNFPVALDMYAFILCEHGKLQININDEEYNISENSLILYRPGEIINNCTLSPDFKGKMLNISHQVFVGSFSDSDYWDLGIGLMQQRIIIGTEENVKTLVLYGNLLQAKIKAENTLFQREIILSIVKAAIYELLSIYGNNKECHDVGKGLLKQSDVLFKRFITLLVSLQIKPRDVKWYADQLCISPKYLSSVCKNISGKTASEWIKEYVHLDICKLLRNSNKTIKEISNHLGFSSMSFFGKYVKAQTGLSPTSYRQKIRLQPQN